MKRRLRNILNFFAFNLLFFALILNFIHKDKQPVAAKAEQKSQKLKAFGGTILVDNNALQSLRHTMIVKPAFERIKKEQD